VHGRGSRLCAVLPGAGVTIGKDALDFAKEFPNVDAWMQRMGGRASVKKVAGDRAQVLKRRRSRGILRRRLILDLKLLRRCK
jgi:hypothetical protein